MKNIDFDKLSLPCFGLALLTLLIDCYVYTSTQSILYRNILMGVAYGFMGMTLLTFVIPAIKDIRHK